MKTLATSLANVNAHGHVRIEPGTQVTTTAERLDGRKPTVIESITSFDY